MTPFEKWAVWITSLATFVTGAVYLWMKYAMDTTDPWSIINHPLQPWVLKAHIVAAPLLVFAVGVIALRHVWRHFLSGGRAGRRTGIVLSLVIGPMVLSGYLIQVLASERWIRIVALIHIALGVCFVACLAVHQLLIGARRRSAQPGTGAHRMVTEAPRARLPVGSDGR